MDFSYNFQPRQIVCLEHQATHLYAEVIQVVESRRVGWVRPLLLAEFPMSDSQSQPLIYDLRSSADLLWSLALFRPALDTEVMPLLLQLLASEPPIDRDPVASSRLHQFIHQAWQTETNG
jgi:hypothetical protein